jgi:hypothetical protein
MQPEKPNTSISQPIPPARPPTAPRRPLLCQRCGKQARREERRKAAPPAPANRPVTPEPINRPSAVARPAVRHPQTAARGSVWSALAPFGALIFVFVVQGLSLYLPDVLVRRFPPLASAAPVLPLVVGVILCFLPAAVIFVVMTLLGWLYSLCLWLKKPLKTLWDCWYWQSYGYVTHRWLEVLFCYLGIEAALRRRDEDTRQFLRRANWGWPQGHEKAGALLTPAEVEEMIDHLVEEQRSRTLWRQLGNLRRTALAAIGGR